MKKVFTSVLFLSLCLYLKAQTAITVIPSVTDANITTNNDAHYTYIPSGTAKNKLVLFLPGTGAIPMNYTLHERTVATLGFHVIGLTYVNDVTINGIDVCGGGNDTSCYRKARLEVLTGQDLTTKLAVNRANSIENRLIKLLKYLNQQYPTQGWGQYLSGDQILWNKIITEGHSQGAGHAAFIAKTYKVDRAIMYCWADWITTTNIAAPWVGGASATPNDRYFAFINVKDGLVAYSSATSTWQLLGLSTFGKIISIDTANGNFRGTHTLVTNQEPASGGSTALGYHNMPVANLYTPSTNLDAAFKPVWEYFLTTPLTSPIKEINPNLDFNIYPNPVSNGILHINRIENKEAYTVSLINNMGQVVLTETMQNHSLALPINRLNKGIYFVKISNKQGVFVTKLIVLM
jgi:hypothetical protein